MIQYVGEMYYLLFMNWLQNEEVFYICIQCKGLIACKTVNR